MATNKKNAPNIDDSDPTNYPDGRIRDNNGSGNGTPVNRLLYSDLHEFFAKLMRLAGIVYNGLPDNESNGYQLVEAAISLAGKNDFVLPLNVSSGVIQVNIKLSTLKEGEMLTCKAAFNYDTESSIKGTEPSTKTVSVPSKFKTGEYVRLVNSSSGIELIRLGDSASINAMVTELLFLKAATEAEEYAGALTSKATTPYTNQLAFARRVIGLDSGLFLATNLRNGLLSKEDKARLDALFSVKNVGWFSGADPGFETVGVMKPRAGDISVAQVAQNNSPIETIYTVTFANAMANTNYFVRIHVQSEGTITSDDDLKSPVFKVVSTTQVQIGIQWTDGSTFNKNLKIHLEAVQI